MTTRFRALRNFLFAGRDVRAGEELELDDGQVRELIWMHGTIEPVDARDRARVLEQSKIGWQTPEDSKRERARNLRRERDDL